MSKTSRRANQSVAGQNRDHGDAGVSWCVSERGSGGGCNPVRTDVLALPLPQVRLAGRDGPIRVLRSRFSGCES